MATVLLYVAGDASVVLFAALEAHAAVSRMTAGILQTSKNQINDLSFALF